MDRSGWDAASWVDQELAGSTFKDERLGRRLRKLLVQMAGAVGAPIPLACQDWAGTKAAYRFLSNEAVSEAESRPPTGRSWCCRTRPSSPTSVRDPSGSACSRQPQAGGKPMAGSGCTPSAVC